MEYYGIILIVGVSVISIDVLFWKVRLKKKDFINYNFVDYFFDIIGGVKFLILELRGIVKVKLDDLFYLLWIKNLNNVIIMIKIYDLSVILIDMVNVNYNNIENLNIFFCGVNIFISDYFLDFINLVYYMVEFLNLSGVSSEVFRINLDESC